MSMAAVGVELIEEDDRVAVYKVVTADFSKNHEDEEIGRLTIDKINKKYHFEGTNIWKKPWEERKIVPPEAYKLSEEEYYKLLKTKYPDARYGAWTGRINGWANCLINELSK